MTDPFTASIHGFQDAKQCMTVGDVLAPVALDGNTHAEIESASRASLASMAHNNLCDLIVHFMMVFVEQALG